MDTSLIQDTKGLQRLTLNARGLLQKGFQIAIENHYSEFKAMHLFYVMLQDKNNVVGEIVQKVGIDVETTLNQFLIKFKESQLGSSEVVTEFSEEIKEIINTSFVIASDLQNVYVGTEHLLLSMFKFENIDFILDLKNLGINYETVLKTLMSIAPIPEPRSNQFQRPFQDIVEDRDTSLEVFSKNMNELSQSGNYPNITGRDKEIKRLIHILARKTKNNPILVGDAGVGKTAIVEGLVNNIVAKKVPASFLGKKIISIDVSSILAGARLRGDVEERLSVILEEVMQDKNTIIFIDEIHQIVGAGSAGARDSMDIANILKPYLTNSSLSIIGATTQDEYSRYFETDSALARRFQPIFVDELSKEASISVIKKIVPEFENFHNVKIKDNVVEEAVDLSSKFIKDRFLPDKAIDLIDEAAASLKVGREIDLEPELAKLGEKLLAVQAKKQKALDLKDFKEASEYKDSENNIIDEIEAVVEGRQKTSKKFVKTVTVDLIKDIVVEWTKIPIAASDISDKTLKDLGEKLKKQVIGQERIIDEVTMAIQRSHLGLNDDKRPLASLLLLGPTGVGKTELAKTLAKELFGSEKLLYQINMSEFMEQHSVSKLIGSPPGYIGYQEGGQLTTFVKRKPYSVILFDEIEKSHPDVLNLLLQILEEGELTDGKGIKVSMKNVIIIMTSNIGARDVSSDSRLGFDTRIDEINKEEVDMAYEDMRTKIMEDLRLSIRPEILNRIDLVDIFRGLNRVDCLKISRKLVNEFILRMVSKGIYLTVDDSVVSKINTEGYSKDYGARNIRRKVQDILENGLARFLLENKISKKRKDMVKIKANLVKDQVAFEFEK